MLKKQERRYRRHKRVRAKIFGTAKKPRLCVFRSAKHIYAQLIDDERGMTLASANDLELTRKLSQKGKIRKSAKAVGKRTPAVEKETKILVGKVAIAYEVGKLIAEKAIKKKIGKAVFDRGGYKYHGRVKALAEGAREGGLKL